MEYDRYWWVKSWYWHCNCSPRWGLNGSIALKQPDFLIFETGPCQIFLYFSMSCLQKSLCWDTIAGAGFGAIWIVPATWMPSGLAAVIKFGIRWSRWSVWILWEHLVLGFSKSRLCRYIGSPKLGPLLLSAVIVPGENEFIQMDIELELMGWARHQKVQCGLKPVDLNLI